MLKLRGISVNKFFQDLGINRQSAYNWKRKSCPFGDSLLLNANKLNISMVWIMTSDNNQDTSEIDSLAQIVNRIENQLECITKQKKYEHDDNFYSVLTGIVEPYELGDWFNGRQIPDIHKIVLIAEKLSVDLQYLITGTNIEYVQDDIKKKERNFFIAYNSLDDEHKKNVQKQIDFNFRDQYNRF